MGSPISSTIADLVLGDMENNILKDFNSIALYKRYVDDILIIANNSEINITNKFNNYHDRLKFTIELGNNNQINFLDLSIFINKKTYTIYTNWYKKPIKTDRYLHYFSHTSINYKKSLIYNLVDRAILLSNPTFHNSNLKIIHNILIKNEYPINFIHKYIQHRLNYLRLKNTNNNNMTTLSTNTNYNPIPPTNTTIDEPSTLTISYIPQLAHKLQKLFKDYNIKIIYKNTNTFHKEIFSKLKDNTDLLLQSEIIYSINCNSCNAIYIGQTKQYLKNRINQHKNSIQKKKLTPNIPNTALSDHAVDNLHNFNFNNVKILNKETNYKKRLILEMIHIKKELKSINYRTDITNLNSIYNNLI